MLEYGFDLFKIYMLTNEDGSYVTLSVSLLCLCWPKNRSFYTALINVLYDYDGDGLHLQICGLEVF